MSKIGKKLIHLPAEVVAEVKEGILKAKGPKGELSLNLNPQVEIEIGKDEIKVSPKGNSRQSKAIWGLTRALVNNIIIGVKEGYEKKLELQGVGFRMSIQGKKIVMALGFSHPVEKEIPEDLNVKVEDNNTLSISGIDKSRVGQFAAEVRALKKVEPYKGKGFRYQGEKVRRKVGKKAATAK